MSSEASDAGDDSEEADVREVETVPLRRGKSDGNSVVVSVTDAIRAAGLADGGSFRFMPGSVAEIGMLAALGSEEQVDGRREQFSRNIRSEGGSGYTRRLVVPRDALAELIDPDSINWDDPPEMNVWAGDRLLAFEMADPEERTIEIGRDATGGEGEDR